MDCLRGTFAATVSATLTPKLESVAGACQNDTNTRVFGEFRHACRDALSVPCVLQSRFSRRSARITDSGPKPHAVDRVRDPGFRRDQSHYFGLLLTRDLTQNIILYNPSYLVSLLRRCYNYLVIPDSRFLVHNR